MATEQLFNRFIVIWVLVNCIVLNCQSEESIVFPLLPQKNLRLESLVSGTVSHQAVVELSQIAEEFSLDFFQRLSRLEAFNKNNFIVAPISIWSLLMLLAEGASGNTYKQLRTVLRLPNDLTRIRMVYKHLQQAIIQNSSAVDAKANQVLFFDKNRPIDFDFQYKLEQTYEADYIAVDFIDRENAYRKINNYISEKTNGKINDVIQIDNLNRAQMVLVSAIFFQGHWKEPFRREYTTLQPFYDENNKKVADVQMMYRRNENSVLPMPELNGYVLQLRYGADNRFSMLLMLPKKGSTLVEMIDNLRGTKISTILERLKQDDEEDGEETVEVYLPRFKISSDYSLNNFLKNMGLKDIFDERLSDLSNISKHLVYVSEFIQKTVIEVDEIGTAAASATTASVQFTSAPLVFYLNRPFAFLIVEHTTNAVLFCGQVKNPAQI